MSEKLRDEVFAKRIVDSYPNLPPDERRLFTFCRSFLDLLRENGELREVIECMMCPVCDLNSNSEKSEK